MGPSFFNLCLIVFNFSAINVALFRREHVDAKDASVCIFVVLNHRRSTFLEIT